jgi:hypothetical protein
MAARPNDVAVSQRHPSLEQRNRVLQERTEALEKQLESLQVYLSKTLWSYTIFTACLCAAIFVESSLAGMQLLKNMSSFNRTTLLAL